MDATEILALGLGVTLPWCLVDHLADCLTDRSDPANTIPSCADMIGARLFAIACGYEDCEDLDMLRFDPAFKLACGRLPESGRDSMSQLILSRLENAPLTTRQQKTGFCWKITISPVISNDRSEPSSTITTTTDTTKA